MDRIKRKDQQARSSQHTCTCIDLPWQYGDLWATPLVSFSNGLWSCTRHTTISFVGSRVSHYGDVIMGAIASQITSLAIVCSTIYSDADHRKHQSSASLAFVRGIHRGPVNFPHKWPVTRKMFPFDDVIMSSRVFSAASHQRARHIRINTVTGLLGGKYSLYISRLIQMSFSCFCFVTELSFPIGWCCRCETIFWPPWYSDPGVEIS